MEYFKYDQYQQIMNILERFFNKVEKTETCWIWMASKDKDGYGKFSINKKSIRSHRFAYELLIGKIPEGMYIDHLCRVRHCVNPIHLEPVTNKENIFRGETGSLNAKKTTCPKGHNYSGKNKRGRRICNICRANDERIRRQRKRNE